MPFSGLLAPRAGRPKEQTAPGVYKIIAERDGCPVRPAVGLLNGYTPTPHAWTSFLFCPAPLRLWNSIINPCFFVPGVFPQAGSVRFYQIPQILHSFKISSFFKFCSFFRAFGMSGFVKFQPLFQGLIRLSFHVPSHPPAGSAP